MNHARLPWPAAWRLARRDLSHRLQGLWLLLVCLFLGVGALAAIGTLTGTIEREIASQGRAILGGDLSAEVWQRPATDEERAAFADLGEVSSGIRMQAMATAGPEADPRAAPIELKAVDARWPMVGTFTLADGRAAGAPSEGEAWLARGAADRLDVREGDTLRIGNATLTYAGTIGEEPDRLGEGFSLGPAVIVREDVPAAAGLTAPGAMYRTRLTVATGQPGAAKAQIEALEARFPDAGWEYRTADRAAPGAERFVGRMGEFLILVGLAALVIAGIGIAGGVAAYVERRRASIATLKILGATSGDIGRIYGLQIGAVALAGGLAGLVAGVAITPLLARALEGLLPVSSSLPLDGWALGRALGFGMLVALVFSAPPLAAARDVPAMALMRERVSGVARVLARWRTAWLPVLLGLAGIVALALIGAPNALLSALFLGGAAVLLGVLALLGTGIRRAARAAPRPGRPILRQALANLHRPGAQTPALVVALGFGLSAFVLLAAVQTSVDNNITARVPERAPDFFVLDVAKDRAPQFREAVEAAAPGSTIRTVPALRGRSLAYGPENDMVRVDELEELPPDAWPLRGERGLTYSPELPEGNSLTEGEWWEADHAGENLVSIDADLAEALDLRIGDMLTVGVLGVERSARIASFRTIDWDSLGFNYVLVFSPNTLADAPHNLAATIELPEGGSEGAVLRTLVRGFPSSSVIEVGPILKEARALLEQVGLAILAAASVAVLAGLAVLVGALAAARAARVYDSVVLRVLGASRRQLLALQLIEYALLCALLAGVALVLGSALAWLVVTQMFEFDWLPGWPTVFAVLGAGLALVLAVAVTGSWRVAAARPAAALRAL